MVIELGLATNSFDVVGVALAPSAAGVYAICRPDGTFVYIGQADNLRQRLTEHLLESNSCIQREGGVLFEYELCAARGLRIARLHELLARYPATCNPAIVAG
jgi:hypothetical protein